MCIFPIFEGVKTRANWINSMRINLDLYIEMIDAFLNTRISSNCFEYIYI